MNKISLFLSITFLTLASHSPVMAKIPHFEDEKGDAKYNIVGVALFSGTDPVSKVIKGISQSTTSHVGLILSDIHDENKWYSFEATGTPQEVLNGTWAHVQINPWDKVVKEYDGDIKYRLFIFEDQERPDQVSVTNFVNIYDQKPFTKNPFRLLMAAARSNPKPSSDTLDSVFCSELTAKMLMDMKILDGDTPGNYIPADFVDGKSLPFRSGITLTPEYPI